MAFQEIVGGTASEEKKKKKKKKKKRMGSRERDPKDYEDERCLQEGAQKEHEATPSTAKSNESWKAQGTKRRHFIDTSERL
ncbi:hypothetical protein LTR39_001228 [Cryomyces antarcticus]|nr:hypothetical protein LTR39_001228 [Cryomyces antarcticus]